MTVLVILAHPSTASFNYAIAEQVIATLKDKGRRVIFHDLYREGFDPLLAEAEMARGGITDLMVRRHCAELQECEGIIFVHPNWWGSPPAVLKGWIDRVLRPGVAYQFMEGDSGEGVPRGLLEGKTALVLNTADTPEKREQNFFGDPLENIWKKCICEFCGITRYRRKVFGIIVTSSEEQRKRWLGEAAAAVEEFFP